MGQRIMILRQIGCVYLILGTCIAAGLLALPIATADLAFTTTITMTVTAWVLMSIGAYCVIRVNLWFPSGANLITMSQHTLGHTVKIITWIIYAVLLYSLICSYLAASSDLLRAGTQALHLPLHHFVCTIILTIIFATIIYKGMKYVDLSNRVLMSIKMVLLIGILAHLMPNIHLDQLQLGHTKWQGNTFLILICSFGYAVILPSIRIYLHSMRKKIMRVFIIGSICPLILYLIWIGCVQGVIPMQGSNGLLAMAHNANTTSMLMHQLSVITRYPMMVSISVVFISICSLTGLMGVSLCLIDFFADGFNQTKQGFAHFWLLALTFLPPLIIVTYMPSVFMSALTYAGLCCIFILIILPISMFIAGKYKKLDRNEAN